MGSDPFVDVMDFHKKLFPDMIGDKPAIPTDFRREFRISLIEEEFYELKEAIFADDIAGTADALVDMLYVIIGTGITYGIDVRKVWDAVHRANMEKEPGPAGKALKPPGWKHPDIAQVLGIGT